MPKCVQCGIDVPRESMFGAGDDLRCSKCAAKKRQAFAPPIRRTLRVDGYVTLALIAVAVAAYLGDSVPSFVADPETARSIPVPRQYMAAVPQAIWGGQIWRLATSALIHGGIIHLAFNCYWMWRFGAVIEAWMGRIVYSLFFVILATTSISAELFANHGVRIGVPIGLSGVVYGMFGLLFALRRQKDFAAALMDQSTIQIMIGWFFLCILLTASNTMSIANVAHGAGALLGYALGWSWLQRSRIQWTIAVVSVATLVSSAATYMPWDFHYCMFQSAKAAERRDFDSSLRWQDKAMDAWNAPKLEFQNVDSADP